MCINLPYKLSKYLIYVTCMANVVVTCASGMGLVITHGVNIVIGLGFGIYMKQVGYICSLSMMAV